MTVYLMSAIGHGISPWAPIIDSAAVNDRGVLTFTWHESPTAPQHSYLFEDGFGNHQLAVTPGEVTIDVSGWTSLIGGGLNNDFILRPLSYFPGDGTGDPNTQNSGFSIFIPQLFAPPPYTGEIVATPDTADINVPITFTVNPTTGDGGGGVT